MGLRSGLHLLRLRVAFVERPIDVLRVPLVGAWMLMLLTTQLQAADDAIDQLGERLTFQTRNASVRGRVSGTVELELYRFSPPAPALVDTSGDELFNPRLTTFVDLQVGDHLYAFAQARVDRGFDPSEEILRARLDEYTVRFTPWLDGRLNLQVGKFATVVGNWIPRHASWDNPFVSAPLPYEHLTGMWDSMPAFNAGTLLGWAHVPPKSRRPVDPDEKYVRLPLVWGPSYATGFAMSGEMGQLSYAAELKNASLSSRPSTWQLDDGSWAHPTFSGRLGYQPNPMWNFGLSGSSGSYLRPTAAGILPHGLDRGDYRQQLISQDVGFAWHHFQLWAEVFEARFTIPRVGNADTCAYYLEARYKLTPQLFAAIRWNEQLFANFPNGTGGLTPWGADIWRMDFATGYRFTPHAQLKFQYSAQYERFDARGIEHLLAAQFVVKF